MSGHLPALFMRTAPEPTGPSGSAGDFPSDNQGSYDDDYDDDSSGAPTPGGFSGGQYSRDQRGADAGREPDRERSRDRVRADEEAIERARQQALSRPRAAGRGDCTDRDAEIDRRLEAFVDQYPDLKTLCMENGVRRYIEQPEARAAFNDVHNAEDPSSETGGGGMASTKISRLRGIKVVVKKHCRNCGQDLNDESIDNAYWEDRMHRYLWGAVAQRKSELQQQSPGAPNLYGDLLARLSVPGCMKWSDANGCGLTRADFLADGTAELVYTVQAFAHPEDNYNKLMSLRRWLNAYGPSAPRTAVENICKAYGESMATFHSLGIFHSDLHTSNVLVYYDDVLERIGRGDHIEPAALAAARNDPVRLRFIDWGFANAVRLVPGADGRPQYCMASEQGESDDNHRSAVDGEFVAQRGSEPVHRFTMPGVKVKLHDSEAALIVQRQRYRKHEQYISMLGNAASDVGCRSERPSVLLSMIDGFGNRPHTASVNRTQCGLLRTEVAVLVHDAYKAAVAQLPAIQPLDPHYPDRLLRPRLPESDGGVR